jgi:glycosyltransferase involved in cell wall biosynthesis
MLADSHGLYDDRIYWKEALSLKKHGYDVYCIIAGTHEDSGITDEGITYFIVKRKVYANNRYFNFLIKKFIPGGLYSKIFKQAEKLQADVYHLHDLKLNKIGPSLKKLSHRPIVIYDVHEPYPENIVDYNQTNWLLTPLKKLYARHIKNWELRCAKKYDFIITTEENLCNRFRKDLPDKMVDIIYNYTDLAGLRKGIDYEQKKYDAIYTGGITHLRGAFKILEAARIAKPSKPDLKILFIGSYFPNELKDKMMQFVDVNGLNQNVILKDSVPYSEIAIYYNESKVGLGIFLPIPTHRIILQIKIFEYMNFGLPIIGSNFGHIANLIEREKVGMTVDPENPKEIATAILALLDDREKHFKYSKNGIKAVDEKYNWQQMERKLAGIYDKILSDK